MVNRLELDCTESPSFFGAWSMDCEICDGIVDFFEHHKSDQSPGGLGVGIVDLVVKNATDIVIMPKDLESEGHEVLLRYMDALNERYTDYLTQRDYLKSVLKTVHMVQFNIQKYDSGGYFCKLHANGRRSATCTGSWLG